MKIIIYFSVAILFISCSHGKIRKIPPNRLPTIRVTDPNLQKVKLDYLILENSGTISPAYLARKDTIDYLYCVNSDNIVTYIAPADRKFVTPEHAKIGSTFRSLKNVLTDTTVYYEIGWRAWVKLPSGWNASFDYELYATNKQLRELDTVSSFFKR